MKKSGFTKEQIIGTLRAQEVGATTRWAISRSKRPVRGCRGASTGAMPAFSFGTTLTFKPSGQRLRNRRLS
jgi:hypothetical protein